MGRIGQRNCNKSESRTGPPNALHRMSSSVFRAVSNALMRQQLATGVTGDRVSAALPCGNFFAYS
jgi:hypothetical protein